jgi:predicted nucleic acid-binding protein
LIVLDASALTDWLLGVSPSGPAVAEEIRRAPSLHTLHLADIEVLSAIRRMEARGELNERRALEALADLAALRLRRHAASQLALRIWELRASHSAYDAAYLALAEALFMPLLTTDHRLARSTGHRAQIVEAGAGA